MSVSYLHSFRETARLSPGRYTSVTGYESSRGSIGNYLFRPGVSKKYRLEESIEWAQRLNAQSVIETVNHYYSNRPVASFDEHGEALDFVATFKTAWPIRIEPHFGKHIVFETVDIPLAGVQSYIDSQVDSWETSKTKPQRANPYRAIASAKNGQPILNVQKEGTIECFYIVGQKEGYKHIQDGEPKAPPKSDSARVKKWVRDNSESGKYITLKLQTGEDQNFESVCINGQVYNAEQLRAMVIEAQEAL